MQPDTAPKQGNIKQNFMLNILAIMEDDKIRVNVIGQKTGWFGY